MDIDPTIAREQELERKAADLQKQINEMTEALDRIEGIKPVTPAQPAAPSVAPKAPVQPALKAPAPKAPSAPTLKVDPTAALEKKLEEIHEQVGKLLERRKELQDLLEKKEEELKNISRLKFKQRSDKNREIEELETLIEENRGKVNELQDEVEMQAKEAKENDRNKNPFKYFIIDNISEEAFRCMYNSGKKEEASLSEIAHINGEDGKELRFFNTSSVIKSKENTVSFSSNGFTLQLQNIEEVRSSSGIQVDSPKARYNLVSPDWKTQITGLPYKEGIELLQERAGEYQDQKLAEFNALTAPVGPTPAQQINQAPAAATPEEVRLALELDQARTNYAEKFKEITALKNKLTSKVKKAELERELKNLEEEYNRAAATYGEEMYKAKEAELAASAKTDTEKADELAYFKQKNVYETIVVDEHDKLDKLVKGEKGAIIKGLEKGMGWYMRRGKWTKMAISITLTTTVVFVLSSATVAAAGGLSYYAGKKGLRAFAGGVMGERAVKGYVSLFKDTSKEEREAAEEELKKLFEKEDIGSNFSKLRKDYALMVQKEKDAERERMINKGVVAVAAGGATSYGLGFGMSHLPGRIPGVGGALETKPSTVPPHGGSTESIASKGLTYPKVASPVSPGDSAHSTQAPIEVQKDTSNILHTTPQAVPETAPEAAPATIPVLEGAGHVLDHPVDFEIEKGEGGLEHAFEKLLLDRTLPKGDLSHSGVVLDQEGATRTLNEAANLVRLSEGHNTAGITVAEFNEAVKISGGQIHIDHDHWNHLYDRLHHHSGVTDISGAKEYTRNVDWVDKVQAKDLHAVYNDMGHPEVNSAQVDVSHVPSSHEVIEAAARAKVLENMAQDNTVDLTPGEQVNQAGIQNNIEHMKGHNVTAEDLLRYRPGAEFSIRDTVDNIAALSTETLIEIKKIAAENLHHIFPKDTEDVWNNLIKDEAADKFMSNPPEGTEAFSDYLHKLQDLTDGNVRPIHGSALLGPAETNESYVGRAFAYLATHKPEKLVEAKL